MNSSKIATPKNSLLARLCAVLILFLAAFLLENTLKGFNVYPLYLVSILYASINLTFLISIPISGYAAFLSLAQESHGSQSFINIFIVRATLLIIISFLFSSYFRIAKTYRRRFELYKGLVPQCPDCGAILCNDSKWRSIEEIADNPDLLGTLPKHGCNDKSDSPFIKVL